MRGLAGIVIMAGFCLLSVVDSVEARVSRYVKVSYEARYGWSDPHLMEVTFLKGRELNAAMRTYEFDSFSTYALLWFAQDQVAIVKIDRMVFGAGSEFDGDDFERLFQIFSDAEAVQVNGNGDRRWKLTAKEGFKFIDPRASR
jgi:hypothetical protein